ncbi:SGNH/GDSL hydrolase family protein [Kribbella sp. NPDC049174]|uniref:SGNH/GDSL hydrolase family protein n=1 Tax=Kribbella sp. NPDC049174 TaxID=3364112 RepID=UPI003710148E
MKHTRVLGTAAATLALLVGTSVPAQADFGSGTLGNWPAMSHAIVGNWNTAEVGIIGDSITTRCYRSLVPLVAAQGESLAVNYWSGRPTAPTVDWLLSRPTLPRVLVVQSGSNDIFDPRPVSAQIARLKARIPAGTTLLWVDVQVSRTRYPAAVQVADQRNSMWVNNQVRENLPKSQIIPWSWWFSSNPGRLPYYLQDGVHPWAAAGTGHGNGCAFWASVVMSVAGPVIQ